MQTKIRKKNEKCRNFKRIAKRNSSVFLLLLIVTRYWIRVNYATKRTLRMRIFMNKKTLTLLLAYTSRLTDRIKSHFHRQTSSLKLQNRLSFRSTKAVRDVCSCSLNTARSSCFFNNLQYVFGCLCISYSLTVLLYASFQVSIHIYIVQMYARLTLKLNSTYGVRYLCTFCCVR